MSRDFDSKLGSKLLINLHAILEKGKDDSVLVLFNVIAERILQGGWRGECSFLVDEFKVRKVQFIDRCNLDLTREIYKSQSTD